MAEKTLGENIGQSIGGSIKKAANASGLSSIDSSIENFTNKIKYSELYQNLSSGNKLLKINDSSIPIKDGKVDSFTNKIQSAVNNFDKSIEIKKYLAPTTLAIKSLDKIGQEIDKSIESSFLLQTFNIKTTDILCSVFCLLLSTLSCQERNNLYNAFSEVNKATQSLKSGARAANEVVSSVGGIAASLDSIKNSANKLFSNTEENKTVGSTVSSAATLVAAPIAILNNIKIISNALRLGLNFKFIMPDTNGKGLWDLARHVLYLVESQGMQIADEALSKAIKPVEDLIKGITPSICYGTQAAKIQNMIIATIKSFKNKLLDMLRRLMVDDAEFNLKFNQFNLQSAFLLELKALLDALDYIIAHFFDVARACGLSPCAPNLTRADEYKVSDIGNLEGLKNNIFKQSATPPKILKSDIPVIGDNIDDLAQKFQKNLGTTYITPTDIISIYDLGNVPKKIIELTENGTLGKLLDDNYTIYNNNGNIKVVSNIKRNCGDQ